MCTASPSVPFRSNSKLEFRTPSKPKTFFFRLALHAQTFEWEKGETCPISPPGQFVKSLFLQIHPDRCSWINHVLSAFYGQSKKHFSFKFHWKIEINWVEGVFMFVFVQLRKAEKHCWDDFSLIAWRMSSHSGEWQKSHLACRRTELYADLKFNNTRINHFADFVCLRIFYFLGTAEESARKKDEKWVPSHD